MLYSIQFLRGIAALLVVMAHTAHKGNIYNTETLSWFHIGGSGVDLFFIISGFIMCYTTHNKNLTIISFLTLRDSENHSSLLGIYDSSSDCVRYISQPC